MINCGKVKLNLLIEGNRKRHSSKSPLLEEVENKQTFLEIERKQRLPVETVYFIRTNRQKRKSRKLHSGVRQDRTFQRRLFTRLSEYIQWNVHWTIKNE